MNSHEIEYLRKDSNGEKLIKMYTNIIEQIQEADKKNSCDMNKWNIEYFKGFIDFIKQNMAEQPNTHRTETARIWANKTI